MLKHWIPSYSHSDTHLHSTVNVLVAQTKLWRVGDDPTPHHQCRHSLSQTQSPRWRVCEHWAWHWQMKQLRAATTIGASLALTLGCLRYTLPTLESRNSSLTVFLAAFCVALSTSTTISCVLGRPQTPPSRASQQLISHSPEHGLGAGRGTVA